MDLPPPVPQNDKDIVKTNRILPGSIRGRVPVGEKVKVNWQKKDSTSNYVWCQYGATEGYIRISHLLNNETPRKCVWSILDYSNVLMLFEQFLDKEGLSENLKFLLAYKRLGDFDEINPDTLNTDKLNRVFIEASNLIRDYILTDAPQEINISDSVRESLILAWNVYNDRANTNSETQKEKNFIETIKSSLEGAKNEILSVIADDAWRRFITDGDLGKRLKALNASIIGALKLQD